MNADFDAIAIAEEDNVATALRDIAPGNPVRVRLTDGVRVVHVVESVALCHKLSIVRIAAGESVVKYGEEIGAARENIEAGQHVHIHNLASRRGSAR